MVEIYVREFIGIGNYLERKNEIRKGYILVEKTELVKLLDRNLFDTSANKLKIWKCLKWIDAEEKRVTRRVYVKEEERYKPFVKIDKSVLEQLRKLQKVSK